MIEVHEVRNELKFEDLAPAWSELFARAADANIFLSHEWLYTWWASYRPRAGLRLLLAEKDGRLLGIAPLMLSREWRFGMPVRVLRFIGDGTAETDHIGFVLDREQRSAVLRRFVDAVDALRWDVAEFNHIPEPIDSSMEFVDLASERWLVSIKKVLCPRSTLPSTYEALLAAMPARFRTALRSTRRRLGERFRIEFGVHGDLADLPDALEALFANHASRWHAKGQGGVFTDTRKRNFYQMLSRRLLERGWLRFYFLKLDGRIVAQEYCFAHDGTVMLLQEGFDYALAKENVGNVLRSMVFEALIGEGVRTYDFLAGDSRHKRNWANELPSDLCVFCTRRSITGRVIAAVPRTLVSLKTRLRPVRDRLRRMAAADAEK
jgi:CelD/BcsL family acetyltransferase involved in cellulose biosynthesis